MRQGNPKKLYSPAGPAPRRKNRQQPGSARAAERGGNGCPASLFARLTFKARRQQRLPCLTVILVLLGRGRLLSSCPSYWDGKMVIRAFGFALLLSSLSIAGCGTVANLAKLGPEGGKTPFGGVGQDIQCIHKAGNGELDFGTHPPSGPDQPLDQRLQLALMVCCYADLPFTFIGDVVTWPYTVSYTCINQPTPVPPVTFAPPVTHGPVLALPQTSP